jgi:1,4-alpha-glucan branching enzyme
VAALALAASLALLMLVPGEQPVAPTAAVNPAPAQVVTRFVLIAPEAASVHLTGDFVSWSREGIALEDPRGTGIWTTDVTLPPGVYQYTFVVNGTEWVPDPRAVSQVDDGFGQVNSVVIVPGGEA